MNKMQILIVDDEKNIRLTLNACLESAGYLTELAVNGEEAIEKAHARLFDLVFLDMKMPGINGIEVLKNLKAIYPALNVVMMTAYGTIETAVETMKLGAVDYLRKPFSPNEVRELADLIAKRQTLEVNEIQDYGSTVDYAKSLIVKQEFAKAKEWLQKAIALNIMEPTSFNLLGVLYEMESELMLAKKMYRAALAVDPSYTPAIENLHRSSDWDYSKNGINLGL